jgi:hypothetical protein
MAITKWTLAMHAAMAGVMLAPVAHATLPLPYPNIEPSGTQVDRNARWLRECWRVASVHPSVQASTPPVSCRAFEYYDRIGQLAASDTGWDHVRACAEEARENSVLAMLYANGLGVARDLDLATKYACRERGTRMEVQLRVEHLMALRKAAPGARYDHCDFAASGDVKACHTAVTERRADTVAGHYFASWRRALPEQQIDAFDRLLAAAHAFSKARQRDLYHPEPEATFSSAQQLVREHLLAFEKGQFNLAPPQQLPTADTGNATLANADTRTGQRLWLAYSDAWVRFAALRYPTVPPGTLKAALAQWRAAQPDEN